VGFTVWMSFLSCKYTNTIQIKIYIAPNLLIKPDRGTEKTDNKALKERTTCIATHTSGTVSDRQVDHSYTAELLCNLHNMLLTLHWACHTHSCICYTTLISNGLQAHYLRISVAFSPPACRWLRKPFAIVFNFNNNRNKHSIGTLIGLLWTHVLVLRSSDYDAEQVSRGQRGIG